MNVEAALGQFDLLPLQVADLRGPQAMAVGDQDHGRVAMPVAAMLAGAVHQPLDLALGEIAPLDCQVYDVWGAFLGCRFHADKPCLRVSHCIAYTLLLHSQEGDRGSSNLLDGLLLQIGSNKRGQPATRATFDPWQMRPPGRGDFSVSNFHPDPIPGNLDENIFGMREVAGAEGGVACFGLPPWKKLSAA